MDPEAKESKHAPDLSAEEWTLKNLGYNHCLDSPVGVDGDGNSVAAKNFLDTYKDDSRREHTHDLLVGFQDMDPAEEDYEETRNYLLGFLKAQLGPPRN